MNDILNQAPSFALYIRTMASFIPVLCSLVAAAFALFFVWNCRNSVERRLRVLAAVYFIVIGALWLLLSLCTGPEALSDTIRILLSTFAYGIPAVALFVHHYKLRTSERPDLLRWLLVVAVLETVLFALGLVFCATGCSTVLNAVNATIIAVQQIFITYYFVRCRENRHKSSAPKTSGGKEKNGKTDWLASLGEQGETLSRKALENYFHLEKPYIEPEFALADLAEAMGVNRSEISAFINRSYGMNFKRWVNRWRLAEYERLMSLPSNERKNPYKILPMAGFTDSRHYQRALAQEAQEVQKETADTGRTGAKKDPNKHDL